MKLKVSKEKVLLLFIFVRRDNEFLMTHEAFFILSLKNRKKSNCKTV